MGRNASRVDAMHAKSSITITSTAALSTSTMRADRVSARTTEFSQCEQQTLRKSRRMTEHFAAIHCSCFFSYSYSKRSSISIQPIGQQIPAKRLDQRSAVPQFQTAIEYEYEYRCTEYRFAEY